MLSLNNISRTDDRAGIDPLRHRRLPLPYITMKAAAERLGVSPQYARRLARSRPDLGRMIGGRWRVLDGDALAQICENRKAKQRK